MAKTAYAFQLGTRNIFGLSYEKSGGNLPEDSWDKWRPFKSSAIKKKFLIGLPSVVFGSLEKKRFHIVHGLKLVSVEPGRVERPARKQKKK